PSRALALRAVGWDLARVPPEAEDHRLVQRVDARVAALEPTGPTQIGMDHHALDVVDGEILGTVDADELKAVGRVPRLEVRRIRAGAHDLVRLTGVGGLAGGEVHPGDVSLVDVTVVA